MLERRRCPDVSRTFAFVHHRRYWCGLVLFAVPGRGLKYSCRPCLVQLFMVMQWECRPAGLTTASRCCHPAFSFVAATGPCVCVHAKCVCTGASVRASVSTSFLRLVCFFPRVSVAPHHRRCVINDSRGEASSGGQPSVVILG